MSAKQEIVWLGVNKLWSYTEHLPDCNEHLSGPDTCDCGLTDALKALRTSIDRDLIDRPSCCPKCGEVLDVQSERPA